MRKINETVANIHTYIHTHDTRAEKQIKVYHIDIDSLLKKESIFDAVKLMLLAFVLIRLPLSSLNGKIKLQIHTNNGNHQRKRNENSSEIFNGITAKMLSI